MLFLNKYCKLLAFFITASILSISISACSLNNLDSKHEKIKVVASLFPQFDFARQIAGDKAEISLLLPPGTESHTFDPSPSDIINIAKSDLFFYTGKEMEPWSDKIISSVTNPFLSVCNVSNGIDFMKTEHIHSDEQEEEEHEHKFDPHIWLDPTIAIKMVDNITAAFCEKDPQNIAYYKENAKAYKNKLSELDIDFKNMIDSSKRKSLVFAGRFAHLYFIKRYGLDYISAFDSCSTESEPSVKRIKEIISFINDKQIPVIYYEEFNEPKIANSICEQTNVKSLQFATLHNVTKEQLEESATYIDLMYNNLENLRQGLN